MSDDDSEYMISYDGKFEIIGEDIFRKILEYNIERDYKYRQSYFELMYEFNIWICANERTAS